MARANALLQIPSDVTHLAQGPEVEVWML
ncbi:hypothetical protein ACFVTM_18060 [Arthrobacter sp. NPDC058130]